MCCVAHIWLGKLKKKIIILFPFLVKVIRYDADGLNYLVERISIH